MQERGGSSPVGATVSLGAGDRCSRWWCSLWCRSTRPRRRPATRWRPPSSSTGRCELDRYRANVFVDRLEAGRAPLLRQGAWPTVLLAPGLRRRSAVRRGARHRRPAAGEPGARGRSPRGPPRLPALALRLMMVLAARPLGERPAVMGATGVAFGTLVLPYSAQLYGHLLGATLGFGAWMVLRRSAAPRSALGGRPAGRRRRRRRVPAGDRRAGAGGLPRRSGPVARSCRTRSGGVPAVAFLWPTSGRCWAAPSRAPTARSPPTRRPPRW